MGMDAPVLQINSSFEFDPDDDVRMTTEVKATVREAHAGSTKSEYILNQYKRGPKIGAVPGHRPKSALFPISSKTIPRWLHCTGFSRLYSRKKDRQT